MSVAPPAASRRPVHLRRITCEGFIRDDGLIDIEGLLIDTKPMPLRLVSKHLAAGEPIHQMRLRITIDRERRIVDAQASSEHTPYGDCVEVEQGYRRLIGMLVEPGFNREVGRVMPSIQGCTHMSELLGRMASTAFQVLWAEGFEGVDEDGSKKRTSPLGGCHALRLDGPVVMKYFPQHRKEPM